MSKSFIFFLFLAAASLCGGCEPTMFGMPQSQFVQLSHDQQQQVIASYNRQQEIREANRPLEMLISTAGGLVAHHQAQQDNNIPPPVIFDK